MANVRSLFLKTAREVSYYSGMLCTAPEFLSLLVTYRCNFRCRSCSLWRTEAINELSTAQWAHVVSQCSRLLPSSTFVEINGGEPCVRLPVVVELIAALKRSFRSVTMNSNGSLLTADALATLERAGLSAIKVSLYSDDPTIHDDLRGFRGAHEKAWSALERVAQTTIRPEVGILVTARNIREIPSLMHALESIPNARAILQPLDETIAPVARGGLGAHAGAATGDSLWPSRDDVERLFAWVFAHEALFKNPRAHLRAIREYYVQPKRTLRRRCFAGQRSVIVSPNGDVSLCFKGAIIGNLATQSLAPCLAGTAARRARRAIRTCPKTCRIVGCNFSRGFREALRETLS